MNNMSLSRLVLIFALILTTAVISGCDNVKSDDSKKIDNNNIYVLNEKGSIDVLNENLKIVSNIKLLTNSYSIDCYKDKLYAVLYGNDVKEGDSIEVLKSGHELKEIKLLYKRPSSIKIDKEKGLAYVVFAPNSSINYTPIAVIDLNTDTVKEYIKLNDFMVNLTALNCKDGNLYAVFTTDVYDIISIDSNTQKVTYLFNKKLVSPPSSMSFGNDGLLYAIFPNTKNDIGPELKIIDVNNKEVKKSIKLKNQYPTRIIATNDKLYISHLNPLNLEGSVITVYNKQNGNIDYIDGVYGCYWLYSNNNELLVANYKDAEILDIDVKRNKIQKKVKLKERPLIISSFK